MADLYSVISGIQPDQQDILEAELMARQILEANFPDLDLREGTGLRDLTLRPASFLLALCKKGLDSYFDQNTIAGVDDTTSTETLDDLMSNLFLSRKTGTYAVINARIYFARSKNVSLTQDTSFSTDGAILFYPIANAAYPASSLQYDSYQNEWYLDVDLRAADTGTSYNLSEGSLLYFSNFDPYFLHAEINYLRESSSEAETNTEFVARASTAISTRNLINKPSIDSNLRSSFNTIPDILSIGAGDREMYRDFVKITAEPFASRPTLSVVWSSGIVTVTAPAHGLHENDMVMITGAIPSQYNGTFAIHRLNADVFTYQITDAISVATTLPTYQSLKEDLYIHLGGTVDVYCDKELITTIEQYTLDEDGKVSLTGPIIDVKRSAVSGGTDPDTVPLEAPVPYTSQDGAQPNKFYSTSSGLVTGDIVKITDMVQSVPISAIMCSPGGTGVFVTSPGHPFNYVGLPVTIQGVSPPEYNGDFIAFRVDANTFSYTVPTPITLAGTGGSMVALNRGLLQNGYPNGEKFGVVTVALTYFTVYIPNLWAGVPVTGTSIVSFEAPFYTTYTGHTSRSDAVFVIDNSGSTPFNTLKIPGNPLSYGRYVQITGNSNELNNRIWKVGDRIDESTVKITTDINNNFDGGTGSCIATFTAPKEDYGFSERQILEVAYSSAFAGNTVSLETTRFVNVANVQSYLENLDNRVLCADMLARGFDLYLLDVAITVYNSAAPTTGNAQLLINKYLATLTPGSVFIVSELIATLNDGGIENLRTPIAISATFHQKDMFDFESIVITDVFNPVNNMAMFVLNSVTTTSSNI